MLKTIITSVVVSAAVCVLALAFAPSKLGYGIETVFTTFGGGFESYGPSIIGQDGSELDTLLSGTCNLATREGALEATSTDESICAAPGVQAGDIIFGHFPNRSVTGLGGILIEYAVATTADQFGVGLFNATGAATSSYAQATSSFQWFAVRPTAD